MIIKSMLTRFRQDRRGIAAVEFALLAPVMVMVYFAVAELSQGLMANRKVSTVASSIGDLTAQAPSSGVTPSQLADIFNVGATLMQPYPTSSKQLNMRLTSVTVDSNNVPRVDWSQGYGNLTARTKGDPVTLPLATKANASDPDMPFIGVGQSVIMAEAHYAFTSPISYYLPGTSDLHDTLYLSPRSGAKVACTDPSTGKPC